MMLSEAEEKIVDRLGFPLAAFVEVLAERGCRDAVTVSLTARDFAQIAPLTARRLLFHLGNTTVCVEVFEP